MKVYALEHKQYGGYRGICYPDVVKITISKDKKRTIMYFADGGKVTKLTRLITEVKERVKGCREMTILKCQCENLEHFPDQLNKPNGCQNEVDYSVKTDYGFYKVCASCLRHIPYRGEPRILFPRQRLVKGR